MASETKTSKEDKTVAVDTTLVPAADEPARSDRPSGERATSTAPKAGFFTIYKKGQGYWTRMGTVIGAGLLGALITWQLYVQIPAFMTNAQLAQRVALITAASFAVVYCILVWRIINKPANVDFLIATDGEMKKVNWTSKKDLIGSTKVVIFFMFAIAIILFVLDLMFNALFYSIDVLKIHWWDQVFGK